ncbi:hypothetical protein EV653_2498 [Kribbella pratensis]|uniref:Alpha/beta hydrolase n=2 Tax=Kribbella pratensis TaxID=2512112 RepID=A0A4R8CMP1_9ACTN|nr:hypothetical protein EV653_2498 [Kribbella pratensis]
MPQCSGEPGATPVVVAQPDRPVRRRRARDVCLGSVPHRRADGPSAPASDGTLIVGEDADTRPVDERLLDAELLLARVSRLVPQAGQHPRIAMFGHSRGGATTAQVMFKHPEVVAGVDLDGSLRGEVVTGGLDQPFGLMLGREFPLDDPRLMEFLSNLRGPHPLTQLDVEHYGYTDWVVFNPEATRADPTLGAQLETSYQTGTADDLQAGRSALSTQRKFLTHFMDHYLSHLGR